MTTLATLHILIAQGESETLELQRSTAELKRAGETLCAFLNGEGGKVLIGVAPDGRLVGQEVADVTLRYIAVMLGRFEPPAHVELSRVDVGKPRPQPQPTSLGESARRGRAARRTRPRGDPAHTRHRHRAAAALGWDEHGRWRRPRPARPPHR